MRSIAQLVPLLVMTSTTVLAQGPGAPWLTTENYGTDGGGSTSLAFAPGGQPAIAFDQDADLLYHVFDGEDWVTTEVLAQVHGAITLAFAPDGDPAISYTVFDRWVEDRMELRLTAFNGATWSTDVVDGVGSENNSLAFTPDGKPAVTYFAPGGDLVYAVRDGDTWQRSTIDSGGDLSGSASLAFTPGGHPAIGYYIDDIKYAVFDGSSWVISTVEDLISTPLSRSGKTSLAFSPDEWPALTYYDDPNGSVKYAVSNGATWSITTIDSAVDRYPVAVGEDPAFALEYQARQMHARTTLVFAPGSGQPAVSYYDSGSGEVDSGSGTVRYALFDGSAWSVATVDRGAYASLAFSPEGLPAISYQDNETEDMKYTVGTPGSLAAKNRVFEIQLTSDQVVPAPTLEGDDTLSGSARVVVNSETGVFSVFGTFEGTTAEDSNGNRGVIGAGLYGFADPGQVGRQVTLWMAPSSHPFDPSRPNYSSGNFLGNGILTPPQLTEILSGKMYLSVSTTANREGEIRGQIAPPDPRRFRITGVELPADTPAVRITFTSEPRRKYEVQAGTDLSSFSRLADATGVEDASETTVDAPSEGHSMRYFRVLEK